MGVFKDLRWHRILCVFAMTFFVAISPGGVSAIEPVAIPAFSVQDLNNKDIRSAQLSQSPKWILLYLSAGCTHCNHLLHDLETFKEPVYSNRFVILVGGAEREILTGLRGFREKTAFLRWYNDPDREAYQALHVSGTPVIFGIKDGIIEWSISGTPWNDATIHSILFEWINY